MAYVVVCSVSLIVSALTLFSGFGLGTILMPAFALFFPVPLAIASTAVVHLANNIFKVILVGRRANWGVVAQFALPGAAAAIVGAALLNAFAGLPVITTYTIGDGVYTITALKLLIAVIIISLALFDLLPGLRELAFNRKYLPVGGVLSGFLGGLSGQQGVLRAAFLIKAGLDKESFIGTSVVTAVIVDVARLVVYGITFFTTSFTVLEGEMTGLLIAGSLSAFLGALIGARTMHKITLRSVQILVGIMLVGVGLALGTGLI